MSGHETLQACTMSADRSDSSIAFSRYLSTAPAAAPGAAIGFAVVLFVLGSKILRISGDEAPLALGVAALFYLPLILCLAARAGAVPANAGPCELARAGGAARLRRRLADARRPRAARRGPGPGPGTAPRNGVRAAIRHRGDHPLAGGRGGTPRRPAGTAGILRAVACPDRSRLGRRGGVGRAHRLGLLPPAAQSRRPSRKATAGPLAFVGGAAGRRDETAFDWVERMAVYRLGSSVLDRCYAYLKLKRTPAL